MAEKDSPPILTPEQARRILEGNQKRAVKKALEKHLAGKPLTLKEQKIIAQFAQPGGGDPEWVGSYEVLGKLVGLHRASFPRILKQHPDAPRARGDGDHHVPSWRKFLAEHPEIDCRSFRTGHQDPSTKEEIEREKLRQIRFRNDVAEEGYLPKGPSAQTIHDIGEQLKATLRTTLEDELPPILQGQGAPAIRVHMKELNDRLCKIFQDGVARLIKP